jgi:hypothetical protein
VIAASIGWLVVTLLRVCDAALRRVVGSSLVGLYAIAG